MPPAPHETGAAPVEQAPPPDVLPEMSTRVVAGAFQYFEQLLGRERTEQALARIGGEPTLDYLLDPENFVSLDYCARVAKVLTEESGDPEFLRRAGINQLADPRNFGFAFYFLRSLGTPRNYYRTAIRMSPLYDRVGDVAIEELTDTYFRFRYRSRRPTGTRLICQARLGQFAAAPTLWGMPPADAREIQCQHLGATACVYEFRWVPSSRPVLHGLLGLLGCGLGGAGGAWVGGLAAGVVGGVLGGLLTLCLVFWTRLRKQSRHLHDSVEGSARALEVQRQRFEEVLDLHEATKRSHEALVDEMERRKRAEAALLEAQKLEALGRLSGTVAHDFNNLLTVMLNFAEHLKSRIAHHDEVRSGLAAIEEAAQSGAKLTRQLLDFSRTQVVEPRVVSLQERLAATQPAIARLVGDGVRVTLEPASCPSWVLIDPAQLERVLLNLAVNAGDAMPDGGSLRLATQTVRFDSADPALPPDLSAGAYVVLSVTDTGHGMDELTRRRIFEPFFTTKDEADGTGLGLSSSHGIVRQASGTMTVESAPGQGASFRVYLPQAEAPRVELPTQASPVSPGGPDTVLVVDDEAVVRDVLARALSIAGYRVLAGSGPDEATRLANEEPGPIRLLVTDIVMPTTDGITMARSLREQRPTMQVLLISGAPGEFSTQIAGLPWQAHCLAKPFTATELTDKVREVLGSRSSPSSTAASCHAGASPAAGA